MKTFRVLGALLSYPEPALIAALPELGQVLDAEGLLARKERAALGALIAELGRGELMSLQERYVGLFDRSRALSLHLFEHVHGESRDRGQAMVDLNRLYQSHGYALAGNELPDFLPAVLEYASCRPLAEGRALLADMAHILQALGARLAQRASGYSAALAALVRLAGEQPAFEAASGGAAAGDEDVSALDEAWAEPPAFGECSGGKPGGAPVAPVRFYPKGATR
ncbi:MAG: nitrate reductase molybdenum cofactor assembly chaperone [Betaproteobacteria bacterium]|nr:nitrate reductase molybdenum cofactor assembly chaperone [Betaproteobacteria bacterium]